MADRLRVRVAERLRAWDQWPIDSIELELWAWLAASRIRWFELADVIESIAYAEMPLVRPDDPRFERVDYVEMIEEIGRQVAEDRKALCR